MRGPRLTTLCVNQTPRSSARDSGGHVPHDGAPPGGRISERQPRAAASGAHKGDSEDRPHRPRAGNQRHLPGGLGEARRAPTTSRTTTRACTAADLVPVPDPRPLAQPSPRGTSASSSADKELPLGCEGARSPQDHGEQQPAPSRHGDARLITHFSLLPFVPAVKNRVAPPTILLSLLRTCVCSVPGLRNIPAHPSGKKSTSPRRELALPGGEGPEPAPRRKGSDGDGSAGGADAADASSHLSLLWEMTQGHP